MSDKDNYVYVDLRLELPFSEIFKDYSKEEIITGVKFVLSDRLHGREYQITGIFRGKEIIYIPAMDK